MVDGMVFSNVPSNAADVGRPERVEAPPPGSVFAADAAGPVDTIEISNAVRRMDELDALRLGNIEGGKGGLIRLPSLATLLEDIRNFLDTNLHSMREAHPALFQRLRQVSAKLDAAAVSGADQLLPLGDMVAAAAPDRFAAFVDGAEELGRAVGDLAAGARHAGQAAESSPIRHLLQATMDLVVKTPVPSGEPPVALGKAEARVETHTAAAATLTTLKSADTGEGFVVKQEVEAAPPRRGEDSALLDHTAAAPPSANTASSGA